MAGVIRTLKSKITLLLKNFPCVVLIGARQVGKTTLLKQVLSKAIYYDLEKESDRKLVTGDIEYFLKTTKKPLIIDEAQLEPKLFNALRVSIDENRSMKGAYLLSGSSSPHLLKNISESLAGRVAIVEVPTLDWEEAFDFKESAFAKNIFNLEKLKKLKAHLSQENILELCLKGSYPEPFLEINNHFIYSSWYENYIKTYLERDIRLLFPSLKLDSYKRFISMLAFSSGEILNNAKFASSLDVSEPTIKNYLEIAEGTFLWRRLNSYQPNKKKSLIKSAKSYLRDTGLINYFLKIETLDQLLSHPNYGLIWEGFVIEQILKTMDRYHSNYDAYYYRTKNHLEVDLVLEGSNGLVPIEIKSGSVTDLQRLSHLKSFIDEYNCNYGILINNAERLTMLSEKIIQIPARFI
jgi:hypothetical protein